MLIAEQINYAQLLQIFVIVIVVFVSMLAVIVALGILYVNARNKVHDNKIEKIMETAIKENNEVLIKALKELKK